jgi:hypothetical protein
MPMTRKQPRQTRSDRKEARKNAATGIERLLDATIERVVLQMQHALAAGVVLGESMVFVSSRNGVRMLFNGDAGARLPQALAPLAEMPADAVACTPVMDRRVFADHLGLESEIATRLRQAQACGDEHLRVLAVAGPNVAISCATCDLGIGTRRAPAN